MTQTALFSWQPEARLFAGSGEIARSEKGITNQFEYICTDTTSDALLALGRAVINGCSFCASNMPLPNNTQVGAGQFLTLTGGSSGRPKIIQRTQNSWISSFRINAHQFSLTHADSVAVFGNLSHSLALYGLLEALHLGLNAHALADMPPRTQLRVLGAQSITVLYATPTQLRMLSSQSSQLTLPDVRLILCGGGILDQKTRTIAQALCPNAAIHVFYGAAETSFITMTNSETPPGSVGRAYPGVTLQIRDTKNMPTNTMGEVWIKSPYLFDKYLSDYGTDTQRQDGFVSVGEMGQLDSAGDLWLKGRKTRMVTIADQNVFPEAVETFIAAHLEGRACAVIPVSDQTRGHRLIAVLEGQEDIKLMQTAKDLCRAELGTLMTPKKVLFHPSLPLLSSGKVDLQTLSTWVEANQ